MEELNHTHVAQQSLLDDIVALTEKAAATITYLQSENARLSSNVADCQHFVDTKETEVERLQKRITELEQISSATQDAAAWYAWFETKFGDSIFFMDMQRAYLNDQEPRQTSPEAGIEVVD